MIYLIILLKVENIKEKVKLIIKKSNYICINIDLKSKEFVLKKIIKKT